MTREADPGRAAMVRLLGLMRDGKEIRQYLDRFTGVDGARFAVIKAGGAIMRDEQAVFADALAFLYAVGLTPIVVHGGGPQLDAALAERGVGFEVRGGLRVTSPAVLAVARDVFAAVNLGLAEAVRAAGARAASIPMGVFEAGLIDEPRLGLVGAPRGVRLDLVQAAARNGAVPILSSLGETADGRLVNINADAAVRAVVEAIQPAKVIMLTGTGGLLDPGGAVIPSINLATDGEALRAADWVTGGMRVKLDEIEAMLAALPLTASVSITRPDALAQELFTHTGAGTLVRRGEAILHAQDKGGLDQARFEGLIAAAFGRAPVPGWWDELDIVAAYVTESYRAGALVERLADGAGYLDKFVVLGEARGEGLGHAVWRRMKADWPRLVWRARPDNPINDFYFREADGSLRGDGWIVFWSGWSDLAAVAPHAAAAAARPASLEDEA